MNGWIVAVIAATVLTIVGVVIFVVASWSLVVDLGRAAQRFRDEVGGLAADIGRDASRASEHASRLQPPGRGGQS